MALTVFNNNQFSKISQLLLIVGFLTISFSVVSGQCFQTIYLEDAEYPVDGDFDNSYCVILSFDPLISGLPIGISMHIEHTYQGDLSLDIITGENVLTVMQRPGTSNCGPSCPCGDSDDLHGDYSFTDDGLLDPENGLAFEGGDYGVTFADFCGIGTVYSFAELWATLPSDAPISANICFTDHALFDSGEASNFNFIFPDGTTCGCPDSTALNYNLNASMDTIFNANTCIYDCDELGIQISPYSVRYCPGRTTDVVLYAHATIPNLGVFSNVIPSLTWSSLNGDDVNFFDSIGRQAIVVIPGDFVGTLNFEVRVSFSMAGADIAPFCEQSEIVEVQVLPFEPVEITGPEVGCLGEEFVVNAHKGSALSVRWLEYTNFDGNPNILVSTDSTVHLRVYYRSGCIDTIAYSIAAFPLVNPVITGSDLLCHEDSTAQLLVTEPFESYLWSTGDTINTIAVVDTGLYELSVVDTNGCQGMAVYDVDVGFPVDINIEGDSIACAGEMVELTVMGGLFQTITWLESGDTTTSIFVAAGNTVHVQVEDTLGCTNTAVFLVDTFTIVIPIITGSELLCSENSESQLSVTESFSSYIWSTGETSDTIVVTSPGNYGLTVVDDDGCQRFGNFNINQTSPIEVSIVGEDMACAGEMVELTVMGGLFQTITWVETGETTETILVEVGSTTYVQVEDALGCSNNAAFSVGIYSTTIPIIETSNVLCFENGESELAVVESFGVYSWSTGEATNTIIITTPGLYEITVSDANGCSTSGFISIEEEAPVLVNINGDSEICEGAEVDLQATTGFNQYEWSTGENTQLITINTAGVYTIEVVDSIGCTGETSVDLIVNPNPIPQISGPVELCPEIAGELSVSGNYPNVSWSNGGFMLNNPIVGPGNYSLSITDAHGCEGEADFLVLEATAELIQIMGATDMCVNTVQELTTSGDFVSYIWSSNDAENTSFLSVSLAGNYSVTATDSDGCLSIDSIEIEEHFLATDLIVNKPACEAIPNGVASVFITEGIPDYEYRWDGITGGNINNNLSSGSHMVLVMDGYGCISSHDFEIEEAVLNIETNVTSPSCSEGSNGAAEVHVIEGVAPYQYQWNDELSFLETISNLAEGVYSVTVTDANDCVKIDSVFILTSILTLQSQVNNVTCFGDENGSAIIMITEGVPPYVYEWNNGMSNDSIFNLQIGSYSVLVTDSLNCNITENIEISSPTALNIVLDIMDDSLSTEIEDGTIETIVTGGTPTYFYNWDNGATDSFIENLGEGLYQLTVTDSNGCTVDTSAQINIITSILELNERQLKVFPNPSSDYLNIEYNGVLPIQKIEMISIVGKKMPFIFTNTNHSNIFRLLLPEIPSGSYILLFQIGNDYFFRKIIVQK